MYRKGVDFEWGNIIGGFYYNRLYLSHSPSGTELNIALEDINDLVHVINTIVREVEKNEPNNS